MNYHSIHRREKANTKYINESPNRAQLRRYCSKKPIAQRDILNFKTHVFPILKNNLEGFEEGKSLSEKFRY